MMDYILVPIWVALQIWFIRIFLSTFLSPKQKSDEDFWLLVLMWFFCMIFSLMGINGLYAYLVYLLAFVLVLLVQYGEYGAKGLCLLMFGILIPVTIDLVVEAAASTLNGLWFYVAATAGKCLPLLIVALLRRLGIVKHSKSANEEISDTLLLRQHMEMQQESMQALEQNYRIQRKSAHEFEHHLQVLRDLLSQNEVDAAKDYLDSLRKNRAICVYNVNSHHPVMDVILNQKYQTARENDIKMQIQVNDLSALDIPTDSLVVVMTNLLDNAIEACRRVDSYREIFCNVIYDDGLYISIRNTSTPVDVIQGRIATSKTDTLSHGFGLMSVCLVLDGLGAEYTFGYEEGWFHFAAEIE